MFLYISEYSLWLKFRPYINNQSVEHNIYVGTIKDSILTKVRAAEEIIKEFNLNIKVTVKTELAKIAKIKKLNEDLKKANNSMLIPKEYYKYMV